MIPLGREPHHDGSALHVSTATPQLGDVVRVRIRVPDDYPVRFVRTRSNPNHEPYFTIAAVAFRTPGWVWWEAEIEVENLVHGYRFLLTLEGGTHTWVNSTGLHTIETLDADDFKLVAHPAPPVWAKSTVMYQVFPDRFARSAAADGRELPEWAVPAEWGDEVVHTGPDTPAQFYGGDLAGIEEHLDHLERLGVTMLYLTPVFPARSNHRYDALSFGHVDPLLGGDDALVSLVGAAHARGLHVLGDLTSNHSGDDHEWFRAAHLNPGAPESEFYYWLDDDQRDYVSWLGFPSLPKLNWNSAELRARFIEGPGSVVAKWLAPPFLLDGWRIDVANMTGRYLADDLNASVRQSIRRTMVEVDPDTLLLAESTNDATDDFQGDAWHGAMTYANFTRPVWAWLSSTGRESSYFGIPFGTIPTYSGTEAYAAHRRFVDGFPWRVRQSMMNALDTHDTPRFATHALPGSVPVAFGLSVTLPGIPVIFAGDEFGLTGDDGEHSRTPMPWDAVDAAAPTIDLYAELIRLRRGHVALNDGGIRWLHVGDDVLVFVREHHDESVLVVAARGDYDITLSPGAVDGVATVLFGSGSAGPADDSGLRLRGTGPSFTAHALPGIAAPPFAAPAVVAPGE